MEKLDFLCRCFDGIISMIYASQHRFNRTIDNFEHKFFMSYK